MAPDKRATFIINDSSGSDPLSVTASLLHNSHSEVKIKVLVASIMVLKILQIVSCYSPKEKFNSMITKEEREGKARGGGSRRKGKEKLKR